MPKVRSHNEWFRTVSLGGRKSCPNCKAKLNGESIWSWGEYRNAKWRIIKHFCKECFESEVKEPLIKHVEGCGCEVNLITKGESKPEWLTIECSV